MTKVYAFEGHVIRLTLEDYNSFYNTFFRNRAEQEYYNKLVNLDDWMHKKNVDKRKWFFVMLDLLEKERQRFEAR